MEALPGKRNCGTGGSDLATIRIAIVAGRSFVGDGEEVRNVGFAGECGQGISFPKDGFRSGNGQLCAGLGDVQAHARGNGNITQEGEPLGYGTCVYASGIGDLWPWASVGLLQEPRIRLAISQYSHVPIARKNAKLARRLADRFYPGHLVWGKRHKELAVFPGLRHSGTKPPVPGDCPADYVGLVIEPLLNRLYC